MSTLKQNPVKTCADYINGNNSIFSFLTQKEKEFLLKNLVCRLYNKGEIIFNEGDSPTGLICLAEGEVKIYKEGIGGREQIIRLARSIGFIGYRAIFAEQTHRATAVSIQPSIVFCIDREILFKLIRQNIDFALSIMRSFAVELGLSYERTVTLTQKHIRGRLAEALLLLVKNYGFESDQATINIYLSRGDIANLSNMTTSNVIRTLSAFAQEGVVHIKGKKIKVLSLDKLERISELG